MMCNQKKVLIFFALLILFALVACSNNTGSGSNSTNSQSMDEGNEIDETVENEAYEPQTEDVTLYMQYEWGEGDFNTEFKEPVEEAFPHVTLEMISSGTGSEELQQIILEGTVPDLFYYSSPGNLPTFFDLDLAEDLTELIDSHLFDLSRIDNDILNGFTYEGGIYGMPVRRSQAGFFYNKEIFDRFAVDYPTNDMTWDDVLDLAQQLTREEEGVQYQGFSPRFPARLFLTQDNVAYLDPDTHEPMFLRDDRFSEWLTYLESLFSIPGIIGDEDPWSDITGTLGRFGSGDSLAMAYGVNWHGGFANDLEFEWGMVSIPAWPGREQVQPESFSQGFGISKVSEHKDQAFEIIAFILSDDIQRERVRTGDSTSLTDVSILEETGVGDPRFDDVDLSPLYSMPYAPGPTDRSKYTGLVNGIVHNEMTRELLETEKDVNTILREQYEIANAIVQEAIANE